MTTLHALYDGVGNITRFYHETSGDVVRVGFQYGHDKLGNPNYELREHQSSEGDEYTYDNLYRLTRTIYDDATPTTPTPAPSASSVDDFLYDTVDNRTKSYLKSATATTYLRNTVNEYTKETLNGTDTYRGYDAAGNLTRVAAAEASDTDGDWRYYYDYTNFMTKAEKYETDAWVTKAEFARDALGRRIEKVANSTTHRYYYDGVRAIEETEGTGTPTVERQYVFGNGIDEALLLFDKNGETYDACYYLPDPLWTVEALVDEDASIVEAYAYTAYGEPTIKTGDGGDGDWFDGDETTSGKSAFTQPFMFTGRMWDEQIDAYYFRARTYAPATGRFLQRDPIGYVDGMNLYNAYFVPSAVDSYGLAKHRGPVPKTYTDEDAVRKFLRSLKKDWRHRKEMTETAQEFYDNKQRNSIKVNKAKGYDVPLRQRCPGLKRLIDAMKANCEKLTTSQKELLAKMVTAYANYCDDDWKPPPIYVPEPDPSPAPGVPEEGQESITLDPKIPELLPAHGKTPDLTIPEPPPAPSQAPRTSRWSRWTTFRNPWSSTGNRLPIVLLPAAAGLLIADRLAGAFTGQIMLSPIMQHQYDPNAPKPYN